MGPPPNGSTVARQLETLPQIEKALAKGNVGYQHVALIARAAENVGSAPVQKEEQNLLKAAQTMDPGRFAAVAKGFEHRVDAAAALLEANHAYERRYLHLSEPQNGMVRLDGMLDLEGGATLKAALSALMPPPANDDDRTPGQRRIDALVDLARRPLDGSKLGTVGGQRPHLVITASAETERGRVVRIQITSPDRVRPATARAGIQAIALAKSQVLWLRVGGGGTGIRTANSMAPTIGTSSSRCLR